MLKKPHWDRLTSLPAILITAAATTMLLVIATEGVSFLRSRGAFLSDVGGSFSSMFTSRYPASEKFRSELESLRTEGRLKSENEVLIHRTVISSAEELKMPPAILWCLLFQESRLNHLEGLEGEHSSRGLGQFSHFSFYEVNNHLDRYQSGNTKMMMDLLGRDIRPVEARQSDLKHPSSYFFIPTAVVTSAAYLNNRYHQLKRILERKGILYDPDLLWLYAAMAYNKGTRSVLTLWNDARRRGGARRLEKIVLEPSTLFETVSDAGLISRSLKKIWPAPVATEFAKELKTHMENMKECTIAVQTTLEKRKTEKN